MSADLPEYVMLQPRNLSGASFMDFKTLSPIENVPELDLPEHWDGFTFDLFESQIHSFGYIMNFIHYFLVVAFVGCN